MPRARWEVAPAAPAAALVDLGVGSPLVAQLLWNRGVRDAASARRFLDAEAQPLHDPWAMRGVAAAVDRLRRALAAGECIAIHGDYDVDGVAAAAILTLTLRRLGGEPLVHIPHRVRDGYGLSPGAVRELAERGARVILTVDCGITANAEVELASSLGVDVVVTDHHHVPTELPAARAVLNPRQPGCGYGFRELSGTGVAYVLARALLDRALTGPAAQAAAEDLLDLVALGTIADLVPLVGENRTLVARGLRVLNAARRPAVRALLAGAGLRPGAVTAQQVGIKIAPPLNAAGRMGEAADAFALLVADDPAEAEALAARLAGLNRDRQQAVIAALDVARRQVDSGAAGTVVAGEFPSGIAGLVAGRLADESGRPTVVLERGDEFCKGSARSPDGFHLVEALEHCADLLVKYGGHAQAAGLTLRTTDLPAFEARFRQLAADALGGGPPAPRWRVDGETTLRAVNWGFAEALHVLEPYGMGNPLPLFLNRRAQVRAVRPAGATGFALRVTDGGVPLRAVAFGLQDAAPAVGARVALVFEVERREWDGEVRIELCVRDFVPSG